MYKNIGIICLCILIRLLISVHDYSGYNTPPMYGDYEAQRHWMEITTHLPHNKWYSYNLTYWGLDYPPITAYHSYTMGNIISKYIYPEMLELDISKGFEDEKSKFIMRITVIINDLIIYIPSVLLLSTILRMPSYLLLFHPSLLLIDHGHFQYNSVCLGLSLLAIYFIYKDQIYKSIISFILALCFKQIALYYALPFFIYLLKYSFISNKQLSKKMLNLLYITSLTLFTFYIIFYPFNIRQVLHRLFPFQRGLFEDKVANFWCASNLFIKWKDIYTNQQLKYITAIITLLFSIPSLFTLLTCTRYQTKKQFIYTLAIVSLTFYLFSFQVHEKSILFPLIMICCLYNQQNKIIIYLFSCISLFSMYPLLKKDGLHVLYWIFQIFLTCISYYQIKKGFYMDEILLLS